MSCSSTPSLSLSMPFFMASSVRSSRLSSDSNDTDAESQTASSDVEGREQIALDLGLAAESTGPRIPRRRGGRTEGLAANPYRSVTNLRRVEADRKGDV